MTKKLGIALGSGGARGWAHIGVLRALAQAEIPVHCVAGASIGALVGGVYAAGGLQDLATFARNLTWRDVVSYFDVVFPRSGLLDGNRIYELLSEQTRHLTIEECPIPFACVATDLGTGTEVCFRTGSLVDAIRASISIPGVFTPFPKDGVYLTDGGIVNPVPVSLLAEMDAEVTLAVNLNARSALPAANPSAPAAAEAAEEAELTAEEGEPSLLQQWRQTYASWQETLQSTVQAKLEAWLPSPTAEPTIFETIGATLNLMEQQIAQARLAECPPDWLLEPDLQTVGIFDFHCAADLMRAGYRATQTVLPQLRDRLR
ncbi:MAG: patatin-like phospholipase family protein [Pseudanabaenaceae cyanobacterium]